MTHDGVPTAGADPAAGADAGGPRALPTLGLPAKLHWRPARPDDAGDVAALLAACEQFDDGLVEIEQSDVVADWNRPSVRLDDMTALVFDGSDLVAYAEVIGGRAQAAVLPSHRGRGIGTALVAFTWHVARRDGRATVGQTVSDGRSDAVPLFERHGYARRWTSWILDIDVRAAPPPRPPRRYDLGLLVPGEHADAAFAVVEAAFGAWPDRDPRTLDDWRVEVLHHERFVAEASPIAVHDGRLVGVAVNFDYGAEGWVHQLAVDQAHRGLGLGRALLAASFRHQRDRGHTVVGLNTDSRSGALTLYQHIGMRVRRSYTLVEATGHARHRRPTHDELTQRAGLDLDFTTMAWASIFTVHRRIVDRMRTGPVSLAGDAAHLHSPAGGQGMNLGIRDAFDLGHRLTAILHGDAPTDSLDAYDRQRRAEASRVLANTDRLSRFLTATGIKRRLADLAMTVASRAGNLSDRIMIDASGITTPWPPGTIRPRHP